ncbi:retrotransposon, Ty1-copia subclass [Paramuricea clavata]|uniref:Retrotransposon, Ty1-copia subclass n=1 Tax=Paramuricea clavata TaxID=317549 RepID=A0A6S7IPI9_PARCT|nr:retrotransposon, Ty1-copia subclass [Paramuricea clavata]
MKTESFGGARFFMTFIDDYSRCVTVYPITHKSEVLDKFKEWEAVVTNQEDCKIKTLRTNNGGEFMSAEFQNFLKEKGIHHETTVPHSPQQNGIAERMNRTLQEAALSMILHPRHYHDEYAGITTAKHTALFVTEVEEPKTLKKALESDHAENWKTAADSEYQSLMETDTWELVELPPGRKAITCRWVKVKHDENGKIDLFKGRLVAKGFLQKYGIEFVETFSPVVLFTSIRALLAFAVSRNMFIHQMDVVTAFLNGTLDQDIYMEQPEGYVVP